MKQPTFDELPQAIAEIKSELSEVKKLLIRKSCHPATEKDELLTIKQAAEVINLRVQTIYGLVWAKKIPFYKQGKKLTFSRDELIKWRMAGYSPVSPTISEIVDDTLIALKRKKR